MPVVVAVHRLKNFDEWFKLFKSNPPPKVGRWRVMRGIEDRNRVHVVAELTASEAKDVKEFIQSKHMQDVFKQVNDISTAPIEFIWLEEIGHIYEGTVIKAIEFGASGVKSAMGRLAPKIAFACGAIVHRSDGRAMGQQRH